MKKIIPFFRVSALLGMCLLLSVTIIAQTTYYVTTSGDDTKDGKSWGNAFRTLQKAIATVISGGQVWVAAGTYYPDEGAGQTDNDRSLSFMLKSGVGIYGGFAGNETQLGLRNWQANVSILSGDLQQNDGDVYTTRDDNAFHVLQAVNTDNTAVIDGFTIQAGHAYPIFDMYMVDVDHGAGMFISSSSPVISNCHFTGNESISQGGGIFSQNASPNISNCTFDGNVSHSDGGGIYSGGTIALTNCSFSNNYAQEFGGGLYLQGYSTLVSCNFLNNSADEFGGAVAQANVAFFSNCVFFHNKASGNIEYGGTTAMVLFDLSETNLTNCTFSGNYSGFNSGGAVTEYGGAYLTVNNCIFWGNPSGDIDVFNATVNYSIVQSGYGGTGNLNVDPLFVDQANGNLHLQPCSPAIDSASDAANSSTTDLDGNARKVDAVTGGRQIDMGAYEFQGSLDADHDGHSYCNNQDCNDNDASVWRTGNFYKDADGDGYTVGDAQSVCYGNNTPAGFTTTKSVTDDCDDNDASVHSPQQYYIDADQDGYSSTTTAMVCASKPPAGYSLNNTDCNDNDLAVHAPLAAGVSIAVFPQGVICAGTPVTFTATPTNGGVSPFYQWQKGGVPIAGETSSTYTSSTLANNDVITVVMTASSNPCVIAGPVTSTGITVAIKPGITATASAGTIYCYGGVTILTIKASGGTGKLQYCVSGSLFQIGNTFLVTAGTYTPMIKDEGGCIKILKAITITQPPAISISLSAGIISCYGGRTTLTITASGGSPGYTYSLNGCAFQNSNVFIVSAGTCAVTVRDKNGCTAVKSVNISQPALLTASLSGKTNVSCYGGNTGSITAKAAGGTQPYSYKINTASAYQSSATFNNLTAGTYSVTVKDKNGCSAVVSGIAITQPSAAVTLTLIQKTNVSCLNGSNGSIKVNAGGGISPYKYSLNSGSYGTSGTFSSLKAGTYTVNTKDANSCTKSISVIINNGTGHCNGLSVTDAKVANGTISDGIWLKAVVSPNPSEAEFTLTLSGNSNEPVEIRVVDMYGRSIHYARGSANQSYKFGQRFAAGVYVVEMAQGKNVKTMKIIKAN